MLRENDSGSMLPLTEPIFIIVALLSSYLALILHRLSFSPIAGFPGPKLAAASGWYEFYYDVLKPGMYIYEIEKMHEKYGPIVRITPTELSINDPSFYDDLYVLGSVRKTNKHAEFCQGTGLDGSALLTHEHDLHRNRRKALDPFFSRAAIRNWEPLLASLLLRFDQRLNEKRRTVTRLDHAFVAFSGDVIRSLTCGEVDYLMDDGGWSSHWFDLFKDVVTSAPLFTSFPWIIRLVTYVPECLTTLVYPKGKSFVEFKNIARTHIMDAKKNKDEPLSKNEMGQASIFQRMVRLDIPESELDTERLTKEAQALFGAATVAVARTMDTIAYYVLADEAMRRRLCDELSEPMREFRTRYPSFAQLEKLPFLHGVVLEGLRLSYGSMHRMPRVAPDTVVTYKDWSIPKNTPVGMSAYLNHTNPSIFPDPFKFDPDRWIGDVDPMMHKALIPFTRGSRVCVGQNLAVSEVTMMIALLFSPNGPKMDLFETAEDDVKSVHDYMIPMPKIDTKGLRVIVR
ncbi:hypothetical protein E8E14_011129 [Neopestalotiopsis sp. 37M]|nr:hypothetical protein E8E14_011129 [Neopestalotiopsis sp. 37M]